MTTHEQHELDDRPAEVAVPVAEEPRIDDESTAVTREPEPAADDIEARTAEDRIINRRIAFRRRRCCGSACPVGRVQAAFVDDPKDCVQQADLLVSDVVEQFTTGFAQARSRLEEQWSRGQEASTEDLRMALMHYREFFDRLLAV